MHYYNTINRFYKPTASIPNHQKSPSPRTAPYLQLLMHFHHSTHTQEILCICLPMNHHSTYGLAGGWWFPIGLGPDGTLRALLASISCFIFCFRNMREVRFPFWWWKGMDDLDAKYLFHVCTHPCGQFFRCYCLRFESFDSKLKIVCW